ncbi:glycosyltransferase family 9 protein, partial [Lacticaseibacillus paracasei]
QNFIPFENKFPALDLLQSDKFNLILHPLTRGRKIEWPLEKFAALIRALPHDKVRVFVTGIEAEGQEIRPILTKPFPEVIDLTGKMSLD